MANAKFLCSYVYRPTGDSRLDVYFEPLMEDGAPSGNLNLSFTDPNTAPDFVAGEIYVLTLSKDTP
ncbi:MULTISPECIES: hypothetical protein [Klebsiella]|uniref:Uncharacterized protein n=1 Tax=Klebsiella electrica TaxID=1259973 RepID=A0AAJ5QYK7_9ENTR|nr:MULTISPECIES: hypothetical protein [Klebsiella]MCF6970343.1 hypothetical protein [Klebsiella variicola]WBW63692.1 hypothetical protein OR613_12760 [Klebsiella electrica]